MWMMSSSESSLKGAGGLVVHALVWHCLCERCTQYGDSKYGLFVYGLLASESNFLYSNAERMNRVHGRAHTKTNKETNNKTPSRACTHIASHVHFDVVPVRCVALLHARVLGDVTMMN